MISMYGPAPGQSSWMPGTLIPPTMQLSQSIPNFVLIWLGPYPTAYSPRLRSAIE